ncbi:hypothetical protein V2G26_019756 [Clonostachys chloroleuca]
MGDATPVSLSGFPSPHVLCPGISVHACAKCKQRPRNGWLALGRDWTQLDATRVWECRRRFSSHHCAIEAKVHRREMCTEKWSPAPQPSISSSPLALVHPRAPAIACENAQLMGFAKPDRSQTLSLRLADHAFIDCTFY